MVGYFADHYAGYDPLRWRWCRDKLLPAVIRFLSTKTQSAVFRHGQQAVVLGQYNAMTFSDRSGGISRRRAIFQLHRSAVPENERGHPPGREDRGRAAVVIRHLPTRFAGQDDASAFAIEQKSEGKRWRLSVKVIWRTSAVTWMASAVCDGMFIGNAEIGAVQPARQVPVSRLPSAYMRANGLNKPVSLTRFGTDTSRANGLSMEGVPEAKTKHADTLQRNPA